MQNQVLTLTIVHKPMTIFFFFFFFFFFFIPSEHLAPFLSNRMTYIERTAMIMNPYNYLTPSVPRHQRERRTHLKPRHYNQNTTSRKPKGQPLSQKLAKRLSQITISPDIQRHTMTEILNYSRSTALERSVKLLLGVGVGWGLKSILRGHNPRP